MSGESSRTAARTAPVGSAQAPRSQFRLLGKRRFLPFFCTQLLGAFNDNVFKQALILAILFKLGTTADKSLLINLCALLFILPFFLFSALGGQLGERFEKAVLGRLYHEHPSSRQLGKRLGVSHTTIANKLREHGVGRADG